MRNRLCPVFLLCLCLALLALPAGAVVKVMPLGDSITRGDTWATSPYPSYRYYLDTSLRAAGYGVDFVGSTSSAFTNFAFDQQHEGHGGYTTGRMVGTVSFSPLASWLAASPAPDIVLLHIGTNDASEGVPLATRLANMKQIVTLLRQKNPQVRVMVAQIIPTGDAALNAGIIDYNRALPALAASLSTAASPVMVVDLSTGYDGVADNQPDGLHPTTTGERKMADAWSRALVPVLSATPTPTTKPPTTVVTTPTTTVPPGIPVPGTLEAEGYNTGGEGVAYHDTTAANLGGAYRTDGVDIEALAGGGYNIGYVRDGEWLRYTVSVATAGQYTAAFRVASWGGTPHAIEVSVNDRVAATVSVPATGAYNVWTTATTTLALPTGTTSVKLRFVGDGQNLDRVVFAPVAATTTPTTKPPTTVTTTSAPVFSGRPVPGVVEAEDYNSGGEGVGYHDTTAGNHDGVYRHDDVDLSVNPSGGYNIGYVVDGEWLAYTIAVPSTGTYTVACSVASWADGRSVVLTLDGAALATLAVPNNLCNGWQTVSARVTLPAGSHALRLRFVGDRQILDRITVTAVATPTTTVPTTVVPTTLGGTVTLPATIQAENYNTGGEGVAYHDTTVGNSGGGYRNDGVDIAYAPSISSWVVTQIRSGEWLEYTVNAPVERDYLLGFRLSSPSGGQFFEMKVDGRSEVTVIIPRTGSYDAYTSISTQVRLAKGTHRILVQFYGDGQNFDSFAFA